MPLRYKIIESKKIVYVIGEGNITLDDLSNHIEELSKDPKYIAPMKKLIDYRQAVPMGPYSEELDNFINRILKFKDIFRGEICAVVVNDDLSFGITRVFASKMEPLNFQTNVFRDFNEALKWLQIQLDDNEIIDG